MKETLKKYFPSEIVPLVESIIIEKKIHFTITPGRKSKFGDYRSPYRDKSHRISVNGNLNKYAFTITFFHEYAHLIAWENFGNKIQPHGNKWKSIFSRILQKLLAKNIFPVELQSAVESYSLNPKASTGSDIFLSKVLKTYDKKRTFSKSLLEIKTGKKFQVESGRVFTRGDLKRTRIWCKESGTNNIFAFNPNTEVVEL